jgi:hypothetical protein
MLRLPRLQTAMMKFQYPVFSTPYCSGFFDSNDEVLVPRPMLFYLPSSPHPFLRPQPRPEIMFYLMILGLVHIDLLLLFLSSPAVVATSSVHAAKPSLSLQHQLGTAGQAPDLTAATLSSPSLRFQCFFPARTC